MAEQKRLAMVIDTKRCMACNSCAVACKIENNLPNNIWWNRVMTAGGENLDSPEGTYPHLKMMNITVACQHCDNPACVKVCPVGATYQDPETGVVRQDYDKCIGCRMCMAACPYTGVRSFNWEEPQYHRRLRRGRRRRAAASEAHGGEMHVLLASHWRRAMQPACMEVCTARARYWGDLDDPESEVSKLIRDRASTCSCFPSATRNPSVYYLV